MSAAGSLRGDAMTTCELRKKAAQVIQERGWHQGYFCNDKGGVCVVGALNVAADLGPEDVSGSDDIDRAIEAVFGSINPAVWNDAHGRTQDEVIARLLDGCEGGEDR